MGAAEQWSKENVAGTLEDYSTENEGHNIVGMGKIPLTPNVFLRCLQ